MGMRDGAEDSLSVNVVSVTADAGANFSNLRPLRDRDDQTNVTIWAP